MPSILDPSRSYTFSNYFDLGIDALDLVGEFGYTLARASISLNRFVGEIPRLNILREEIESILPYTDLTSEAARREVLIAPVLLEVVRMTRSRLSIEYPLRIDSRLQGNLDYLLRNSNSLLVVEAKQADLTKGFAQLAVELIALDVWADPSDLPIMGAVTTGNIWQFGVLHRQTKKLDQGLNLYRVPEDLGDVMRILLYCLS